MWIKPRLMAINRLNARVVLALVVLITTGGLGVRERMI